MSTYDERVDAFSRFGPSAADKIVKENSELFLSVPEKDAFERAVALYRLRSEIEPPTNEAEAYDILSMLLGEMLKDKKLPVASYGFSVLGQNQFNALVYRATLGVAPPKPDPFDEVIRLYKTNITEFNDRRASDHNFLNRSNDAQAAGLLR